MIGMHALKKKYIVLLTTVHVVVLLDLITKACITSTMMLHESFVVIAGFFNITYVRNPGAAFGLLSSASPAFRSIFFLSVTMAVIVLILYYIYKSSDEEILGTFALSLILSGASGNMIDRVRFGEVIDFLDVYIGSHHWPAFNVADSAISIGAILLILELFRHKEDIPVSSGKNRKG
jgi:signal peptidase II